MLEQVETTSISPADWAECLTRNLFVVCDESGHTKFPFWYLAHVILLTLAQIRLSPCSGFAQVGSPLLTLITIFGRPNHFNSSRGGLELVQYIEMTKMCLEVGKLWLKFGTAAGNC